MHYLKNDKLKSVLVHFDAEKPDSFSQVVSGTPASL